MNSAIHWRGFMCVSKNAELDVAISDTEVEFTSGVYREREILIEALERWLQLWRFCCEDDSDED